VTRGSEKLAAHPTVGNDDVEHSINELGMLPQRARLGATMRFLPQLFESNRAWAAQQVSRDAQFFDRLCAIQRPDYLWIGCADSRVPANTIVGLKPGEVFVHRNIANIVGDGDRNALSVLQYAVDVLRIGHVIVCGHYRCGGVQAALGPALADPLETWLAPIRSLNAEHARELQALDADARWNRLCELNVVAQVRTLCALPTIRDAWSRGQPLAIHGWIYDLHDGLLRDLEVSVNAPTLG
jgi:carbonic anhydrase